VFCVRVSLLGIDVLGDAVWSGGAAAVCARKRTVSDGGRADAGRVCSSEDEDVAEPPGVGAGDRDWSPDAGMWEHLGDLGGAVPPDRAGGAAGGFDSFVCSADRDCAAQRRGVESEGMDWNLYWVCGDSISAVARIAGGIAWRLAADRRGRSNAGWGDVLDKRIGDLAAVNFPN